MQKCYAHSARTSAPSPFHVRGTGELKEAYRGWVEEKLERGGLEWRPEWAESIAVGGQAFVRGIKEGLGITAKGRKVVRGESGFELSILAWSDPNKTGTLEKSGGTI